MSYTYLERRDPARNMERFYTVRVAQTMFGEWAVIREWGRIGQSGTVREAWFDSQALAEQAAGRLCRQKEKRGYQNLERAMFWDGQALNTSPRGPSQRS